MPDRSGTTAGGVRARIERALELLDAKPGHPFTGPSGKLRHSGDGQPPTLWNADVACDIRALLDALPVGLGEEGQGVHARNWRPLSELRHDDQSVLFASPRPVPYEGWSYGTGGADGVGAVWGWSFPGKPTHFTRIAPPKQDGGPSETGSWRCFHCDEVLTTHDDALAHFGARQVEPSWCTSRGHADTAALRLRVGRTEANNLILYRQKVALERRLSPGAVKEAYAEAGYPKQDGGLETAADNGSVPTQPHDPIPSPNPPLGDRESLVQRLRAWPAGSRDPLASVTVAALMREAADALAPGHTDLMVTPESLDAWLEANPLPPPGDRREAVVAAIEGNVEGRRLPHTRTGGGEFVLYGVEEAADAILVLLTPRVDDETVERALTAYNTVYLRENDTARAAMRAALSAASEPSEQAPLAPPG